MSSVLIYHHLGLGDHFMCHGIVREYCKKYDRVALFCYPHNYPTVSFMYRDLSNLTIIKSDDASAKRLIEENSSQPPEAQYDEIKIIGFQNLNRTDGIPLEWQFYKIAGIPFEKKWSSFFIKRDFNREQTLFEKVAPKEEYLFVHEDIPRKYEIKRELLNENCAIFTPRKEFTDNLIDYCTIIEKAKEVHVIDSSFMFLIDCLPYHNPDQKLFIHRYARENNEWQLPILKKDWYILTSNNTDNEPIKDFLRWLHNSKTPIFKRITRKIFRVMGWIMHRPKAPNLGALVQRHVPGKSFIAIHSPARDNKKEIFLAQETGAIKTMLIDLKKNTPTDSADIVFYSGELPEEPRVLLRQLHSITTEILIFSTPSTLSKNMHIATTLTPHSIESLLEEARFSVREKYIFPHESCFVCRVIPTA